MPAENIETLLAGNLDQDLLLRNEYLASENEILRARIQGRLRLAPAEKHRLLALAKAMGKDSLREVSTIFKPETILRWAKQEAGLKYYSSRRRGKPGRPRTSEEVEQLIVMLAQENRRWGVHRISGELKKLGIKCSPQTVLNILNRHGIPPANKRANEMSWTDFIETLREVAASADFFTAEVSTPVGFVTFYVLFFMHLDTRKVEIAGVSQHPGGAWMKQIGRNLTFDEIGFLNHRKYLIVDRDTKFTAAFRGLLENAGTKVCRLPPRSPNLNAEAERFILSIKNEMLSQIVLSSEEELRFALREYVEYYHHERPHQGLGNVVPFPANDVGSGPIRCRERLGGLLKSYYREAA